MNPPRLRLSLLVAALTVLAACATPGGVRTGAIAGDAEALMAAAEADLASGDAGDARQWLAGVRPNALDPQQRARLRLLQVEILLAEDRPIEALQQLPLASELKDWPALTLRAEANRARVLFRIGDVVGGTRTLVAREKLMADPEQVRANRELLWSELATADLDSALNSRLVKADGVTRGWIEFATISRSVWLDARDRNARIARWRVDFPQHPAEQQAVATAAPAERPRGELTSVALLLPLSGPYAGTGEAVRDGFLAALYRAPAPRPALRVYDTGDGADALQAAYRRALNEGAEFLVGPLRKEAVAALVDSGRPPVPVLALNYLDAGRSAPFNFYQWGLAPEDEARQAAERAVMDRGYRAVALVPEGEWGERVLRAFQQRFAELGGTVADARTYVDTARDHSEPIRALLALDASEGRHNALTGILGIKTKFEPRRRDDVDLIFMAARPDQATLIWPQFRFHRAADLPAYATAVVYDGEAPEADLNGLRFCDMPWMLSREGEWTTLRNQLKSLFPDRGREYSRLLALGHDAYTLVGLIEGGQLGPGVYYPAASGTLSMREDGVITRGVTCAEIRNGALKPLDIPLVPAAPGASDARR